MGLRVRCLLRATSTTENRACGDFGGASIPTMPHASVHTGSVCTNTPEGVCGGLLERSQKAFGERRDSDHSMTVILLGPAYRNSPWAAGIPLRTSRWQATRGAFFRAARPRFARPPIPSVPPGPSGTPERSEPHLCRGRQKHGCRFFDFRLLGRDQRTGGAVDTDEDAPGMTAPPSSSSRVVKAHQMHHGPTADHQGPKIPCSPDPASLVRNRPTC